MPALSPTMTQGNLGTWHAKIGSRLAPGDVLVEIETDKAQMDLECQEDGFLAKILLVEGTKDVLVGKAIAVMVEEESDVGSFEEFALSDIKEEGVAEETEAIVETKEAVEEVKEVKEANKETPVQAERVFASPAAKTLAAEKRLALDAITGTGPDGLVIKRNVEAHKVAPVIEQVQPVAPPAIQTKATTPKQQPAPPAIAESSNFIDTPVSAIRKVIASRLLASTNTIPHYYLTMDINVDKVLKAALNDDAEGQFKLSVNDFVVKAAGLALQKVPAVNSSWHETYIRQYTHSDISVAVSTPTGLITPIVTSSEQLGLAQISTRIKSLADKAKQGKLAPEEYTGGSFTISNLGMFGVRQFTAIINPPQCGILAVGAVRKEVVLGGLVERGQGESGSGVKEVSVMSVTISLDHRVVDGAKGAEWLSVFRGYLEDPLKMML